MRLPLTLPRVTIPPALAALCGLPLCTMLCVPAQTQPSLQWPDATGFALVGVLSGTLSVDFHGQTFPVLTGAAIGFSDDTQPDLSADTDCTLLCAYVTGMATDQLLASTLAHSPYFPTGGHTMTQHLHPLLHQAQRGAIPDGLTVSTAVYALLAALHEASAPWLSVSPQPPLVAHAIAIIQEDFAHLYGVEDLADRLEVTPSHLIRSFSRAVGITPGQYLTEVRIAFAQRLLRSRAGTMEEIAAFSGFSSASYFGKVFRRVTGLSPSAYARTASPLPPVDLSQFYV